MNKKIKDAILRDSVLLRFKGNVMVKWQSLREEFKDDMPSYYETENAIKFLIGEDVLGKEGMDNLYMTEKGWSIMANIDIYGYESIEKEKLINEIERKDNECVNRIIQIVILIIAAVTLFEILFK